MAGASSFLSPEAAVDSPAGSASDEVQRVCPVNIHSTDSGADAYQVISQELHDEGRVLVALLAQGVELGNGVVKGKLGQVAGLVWRVEDLVVEDGEVQSQTKTDGVGRREIGLGEVGGTLVGLEGLIRGLLALVANGKLGQVTVVVTLPVVVSSAQVISSETHILR